MALQIQNNTNVDVQLHVLSTKLALASPEVAKTATHEKKARSKVQPIMAKDSFKKHEVVSSSKPSLETVVAKISNMTEKQAIAYLKSIGFTPAQLESYKAAFNQDTNPALDAHGPSQSRAIGNYFAMIAKFLEKNINSRSASQIGRLSQVKAQEKKLDMSNASLKNAAAEAKAKEKKVSSKMPWWGWLILAVVIVIVVVALVVLAVATCGAAVPEEAAAIGLAAPEVAAGVAEGGTEMVVMGGEAGGADAAGADEAGADAAAGAGEAGAGAAGGGASAAANIAKVALKAVAIIGGGAMTAAQNSADAAAAEAKQTIFRDEETMNQISTNNANSAQQAISESETQIDNSTKQNQASASLSSSIFQSMTQILSISQGR